MKTCLHTFKRVLLAGSILFLPVPGLRALDTPLGPLGMGARSLALAGAVTAMDNDIESMFWNPAGLANLGQLEGCLMAGPDGQNGPFNTATVLAGPYEDLGFFGISYMDSRAARNSDFRSGRVSLGAAVPVTQDFSLGTQQKILNADPGGMVGWSMDLGAQVRFGLPDYLGREAILGLTLVDAASYLDWQSGLTETQPMVVQSGLSWTGLWSLKLAFQVDNGNDALRNNVSQWRLGAQKGFFSDRLALRLGTTQAQGGDPYLSAGFGALLPLAGMTYRLDYAWLSSGSSVSSLSSSRQLISISVAFADLAKPRPEAAISKVLTDADHKVRHARVSLKGFEGVSGEEWELTITDAQGRPLRTLKGRGPLPPQASWDGRDDQGNLVDSQDFSYNLRVTAAGGKVYSHKGPLAPAVAEAAGLGELAGFESGENAALRAEDTGATPVAPRVHPSLKGPGGQLSGADFDLSDVSDGNLKSWELKVVDSQGRTLRTFSGKGNPPRNLRWEGRDEAGDIVSADLSSEYVLRVVDDKGAQRVMRQDLVNQDNFAAALRSTGDQPGRAPTTRCRQDDGAWRCRFYFAGGETYLNSDQLRDLAAVAEMIRAHPERTVHLHGVTLDPRPALEGARLAQDRANAVLKDLLENYSLRPRALKVTADDFSGGGEAKGTETSFVEIEVFPGEAPDADVCLAGLLKQLAAEGEGPRLKVESRKETAGLNPRPGAVGTAVSTAAPVVAAPTAGAGAKPGFEFPKPAEAPSASYPPVPAFDPAKDYKPLPLKEP